MWDRLRHLKPSRLLRNESYVGFTDAHALEEIYKKLELGDLLTALIKYDQE